MQSLWMLLASVLFALMGVCVKLASVSCPTSQIVMCRGLIGIVLTVSMARANRVSLATSMPWRHLGRGLVGVIALWMWFYTIGKLPLALANTLNYMSPIWIATILFGTNLWYGRVARSSFGMPLAIVLSFVGVLCLLRPSMHADQLPTALVALGSGMLAALAYLQVRQLGLLGEPETRVVFYFSLTSALWGAALTTAEGSWQWPQGSDLGLLLLVGLLASTAQLAMTRAYRLGNPLLTANLSYSGIVLSSLFGMLIWHDQLGWISWLGIAIILTSGILATCLQAGVLPPLVRKA